MTVQTESVPVASELPGRTSPYQIAEVRPQVTGIVKERLFNEGSEVKAGQVLYQIDPATYQAAYDSAAGRRWRAPRRIAHAARTQGRALRRAGEDQGGEQAGQRRRGGGAEAGRGRASPPPRRRSTAREINLGYTRSTSPIAGRIGRSAVTAGALVTANQADALATVQQLDPIYVDLTQSSAEMLRLRARSRSRPPAERAPASGAGHAGARGRQRLRARGPAGSSPR